MLVLVTFDLASGVPMSNIKGMHGVALLSGLLIAITLAGVASSNRV